MKVNAVDMRVLRMCNSVIRERCVVKNNIVSGITKITVSRRNGVVTRNEWMSIGKTVYKECGKTIAAYKSQPDLRMPAKSPLYRILQSVLQNTFAGNLVLKTLVLVE